MPNLIQRPDGSIGSEVVAGDAPTSPHWAQIESFSPSEVKPLTVTRNWRGHTITLDCYVTQDVVDNYQAGNLAVGDFVLVDFVDGDLDQPLAITKIYESW